MKLKKVRGYIFCRAFMGERVPQHVQNIVIRDYCKRNNLLYLLNHRYSLQPHFFGSQPAAKPN